MFWPRNRFASFDATLNRQLDLFNRFMDRNPFEQNISSMPGFNIWADEDSAVVTSEMPGVAFEDLEITVTGKDVSIKGTRREEAAENRKIVRSERSAGEFERTFQLPFQIDSAKVAAKLVNGVLEITLPRAESDKPRKIEVAVS